MISYDFLGCSCSCSSCFITFFFSHGNHFLGNKKLEEELLDFLQWEFLFVCCLKKKQLVKSEPKYLLHILLRQQMDGFVFKICICASKKNNFIM